MNLLLRNTCTHNYCSVVKSVVYHLVILIEKQEKLVLTARKTTGECPRHTIEHSVPQALSLAEIIYP